VIENVKFLGDNVAGDFSGFDLTSNKDEVIEFWHDDEKIFNTGMTFKQYSKDKNL